MAKHLWEVDHAYYCNLGNYTSREYAGREYDSFNDFYNEWHDADLDYNLLFRWDWKSADNPDHELENDMFYAFWMLQRKGHYMFCKVKVEKEDESKVIEFLEPRMEYLKALWEPLM